MKDGWEIKKLGDVCENLDNKRIPITQNKRTRGEIPYYGASGIVDYVSEYIFNEDLLCVSEDGANLLARTYPIAFSISGKTWVNNHAHVLRFENFTTQKIVEIYLNSIRLDDYISGMAQPKLNQAMLNKIPIPLPPLSEQQRIVSFLDEAFTAIDKALANAQQNLKNTKELFESYLQGVFDNGDWETKTLDEVCEISSKLIDPRKPEFQNIIHVGAGNIESKTGLLSDLKTAKEENLISGKFLFDESMVLYSKIRPYLMKVVNCNFQGLCSADIYPLKPFEKEITKDYLYHLLLTKEFTEYAILGSQRAGMPKVNREHLFAYKLKLPSLEEQQTIVRQLDTLREETQKLERIYQQKIADLEELKKSILQKAFAGELNTEKSRRDDTIIKKDDHTQKQNPERVI
jgi:type I restriction enzyme S subunit